MRKTKTHSHRIAIYLRVSTEDQAANPEGSLKSQEQRLRSHVTYRNQDGHFGDITHVFVDRAKSGKDTNRPELQRLLKAIRDREVSLVLVTELSRLSRSIRDFAEIWELMQANSCSFQSLREAFDTTTSAGEMMLYSMANLAQFERRQISERVAANFAARAQRGLYNGGCIPVGYKLDSNRKGYLVVDKQDAEVVRAAYRIFLEEGSVKKAGVKLNEKGYRVTRHIEGGGRNVRLGYFTADNLYRMLINKTYLGIRQFRSKSEVKTVKASWDAIIDQDTFDRVNAILKKNHRRLKARNKKKYPYLLSHKFACGQCGDTLCGKSANGNGGMIPYYEHAWLTKKQACLNKKVFACKPNRVLAKLVETQVWEEVVRVIVEPNLARSIVDEAQTYHRNHSHLPEQEKLQAKVQGVELQLEALAEHLTKVPKDVSPAPIFSQMRKLEGVKTEFETKLTEILQKGAGGDLPIQLKTYEAFLRSIRSILLPNEVDAEFKTKVVERLIHKVELLADGLKIHWYAGESTFLGWPDKPSNDATRAPSKIKRVDAGVKPPGAGPSIFLSFSGSNTLAIGWGGRIRTCE